MITLNLIALLFIAIISVSFCKNSWLKALISTVFSVFICMQISSLYVGGTFCDYKFFVHFNFQDFWWGATSYFKTEVILLILLFIGISAGLFTLSKWQFWEPKKRLQQWIKIGVLIASLLFLCFSKHGIGEGLREVALIQFGTASRDFDDALKIAETKFSKQSGKPVVFTRKEDLTAVSSEKNIVIMSLESFDQAFFHPKNRHLIPNLCNLTQEWTYSPMMADEGSAWTIGSLYTVFTGLPCFFRGSSHKRFYATQNFKSVTLADVLKKSDYEMYLFSENAVFAGTRDLSNAFGIHHIIDGCADLDMFEKSKEILKTQRGKKPVCLYISTFATHTPSGFPDARLFSIVPRETSDYATATRQTDYLIGDFVRFLKDENLLENTVIYIFPDHLFMKKTLPAPLDIPETENTRQLWFLSNANTNDLNIDTNNFYQIDLAKTILAGAKIKHNVTFLSDFITGNKQQFIQKNKAEIATLNASSLEREKTLDENFEVFIRNQTVVGLMDNDTLFKEPVNTLKAHEYYIFFTNELKILDTDMFKIGTFDSACWNYYELFVKISVKNHRLNVIWGRNKDAQTTLPATVRLNMNHADIEKTLASIPAERGYIRGTVDNPEKPLQMPLLDYLTHTLQDSAKIIAVFSYDDASVYFSKLQPILDLAGLKESVQDRFRWSYIAVFSKHHVYGEKAMPSPMQKHFDIAGNSFYVASGSFLSEIGGVVINGKRYVLGDQFGSLSRGLTFVIFNTKTQHVEDLFNVDFYGDEMLRINR